MSSFIFILNHPRATGSIGFNITELLDLGHLWDSDTLISVGDSLNKPGDDANVGDIRGNKMFYTNDYLVSDQVSQYRRSGFLI